MPGNPLIIDVLAGIRRQGTAHVDYLGLLLQAVVLLLWWPKSGIMHVLESGHGPRTLMALMMATGVVLAYTALRAGAEEFLLPGQHGLRDWALATPLRLGRILRGYLLAQAIHSVHLLTLSLPLVLIAFTVSGGEWAALAWCMGALLMQALFYRLCGAIVHLALGGHRAASRFAVRAVLLLGYIATAALAPFASHLVLTAGLLGEPATVSPRVAVMPDTWAFLASYAVLVAVAAVVVQRLLLRERRRAADRLAGAVVNAT